MSSSDADRFLEIIGDVTSDLMLVDSADADELGSVRDGLQEIHSSFQKLQLIEDSDRVQSILQQTDDLLSSLDDVGDSDDSLDDELESFTESLSQLEDKIRKYGDSLGGSGSASGDDQGGSSQAERSEPSREPEELEDLEYSELQSLAQEHDIKANQSTEDLIEELQQVESRKSKVESQQEPTQQESRNKEQKTSNEEPGTVRAEPSDYDEEMFYDFFSEATEHLDAFEDVLLKIEQERDMEALNRGFRGMHSIKGAAGFLDLRWVNNLSHAMEDLLGKFRDEGYKIEESHVDLLFDGLDSLKKLINFHHEILQSDETGEIEEGPFQEEIDRVRSSIEKLEEDGDTVDESEQSEPDEVSGSDEKEDVELRETESIRIDTEKIDTLVNRAGELVTTFNQLKRREDGSQNSSREQRQMFNQLDRIVSELQEEALSLRMVPLKKTFSKTRRQVRDLAKQFGKEVNLVIEGEETELDRSLVDKIQDPLVHLVRNALDHGIEDPETRREKGKDEEGTLTISAFHESGDVVIEISDDGAGIDPDDVLERAIDKGLVDHNEELTEDEIYMLLFEPGFSTTEEVTDVSGRGVGMDVVRKNVESIRGSIEVDSEIDRGTTFRLKIPLTLSIINGMIMKLEDERFIIPTTNIMRSLSPKAEQITMVEDRGEVLNLRGELISLCRLNRLFDLDVEDRPFEDSLIVIVKGGGKKVGLQVDDILGQQEVVIKSLGIAFEELRGVSGAAILGDGNVGLILDTQTLEDIV